MTRKLWTTAEIKRASMMWAAGMIVEDIGAALGRSRGSVRQMIDRNRDHFPRKMKRKNPRVVWSQENVDEAALQWRNGRAVPSIARGFKTSSKAIRQLASRYRDKFPKRVPAQVEKPDREFDFVKSIDTRRKISEGRRHSSGGRQRKPVAPVIEGIWQGRTLEDIAFEQGVSGQALSSRIARWGLTQKEISHVPPHMRADFIASI